MEIKAVVPCVDYDDFLALTLTHNLAILSSITVLTSPIDHATIALATRLGAQVFITDAWHIAGPLNKAYALNEWLDHIATQGPVPWLMVLDADVFLPPAFISHLNHLEDRLDPRSLYAVRRRMCYNPASLQAFLDGHKPLAAFPPDVSPLNNGKLWDRIPVSNPAGLAGYLHLWSPQHAAGSPRFSITGSAEAYDVYFALSFPEENRVYLDPLEVLHIGPPRVNWHGRRSPRWQ